MAQYQCATSCKTTIDIDWLTVVAWTRRPNDVKQMDRKHLQAIENENRVLKEENKKMGIRVYQKNDNLGLHTPYTTDFTYQTQELKTQEI